MSSILRLYLHIVDISFLLQHSDSIQLTFKHFISYHKLLLHDFQKRTSSYTLWNCIHKICLLCFLPYFFTLLNCCLTWEMFGTFDLHWNEWKEYDRDVGSWPLFDLFTREHFDVTVRVNVVLGLLLVACSFSLYTVLVVNIVKVFCSFQKIL